LRFLRVANQAFNLCYSDFSHVYPLNT
jgi:hypothetical protein